MSLSGIATSDNSNAPPALGKTRLSGTINNAIGCPESNIREQHCKPTKRLLTPLNQILKNELTAINPYFLPAKPAQKRGMEKRGGHMQHECIDEMKNADELMDRGLFLEGSPNVSNLDRL